MTGERSMNSCKRKNLQKVQIWEHTTPQLVIPLSSKILARPSTIKTSWEKSKDSRLVLQDQV
jgi:hypothetical protein